MAVLFISALPAYADFSVTAWQYKSKVDISGQTGDYVSLDIPSDAFTKLRSDLADLRVVSEDGEVPYALALEDEKSLYAEVQARMFNLAVLPGQATTFMVDLGSSGLLHSRITINTSSENFRRGVEVYTSDDADSWQLINAKGQIFDFTDEANGVKSQYTTVEYPESARRYLRVVINDLGEAPLAIHSVSVERQVVEKARTITYAPTYQISENSADKSTDIVTDLGSSGIPTSGGELKTADDIFSRGVVIYASNDKKSWSLVGTSYIFSIDTPKFSGANLKFSYAESRDRYIKVSILNGDDRPINFSGMTLSGIVRSIIFKPLSGRHYFLYLGNPEAVKPEYDIEKFAGYLDASKLSEAAAEPAGVNTSYTAPLLSFTERFPNILNLALVGIVLLLLGLLVKLFRSPIS